MDPNCIEATTSACTACDYEFYLDPLTNNCVRCNIEYSPMCFVCNSLQCLECQWPFDIDQNSQRGDCVSTGVVEFTDLHLNIVEDQQYVNLNVRRNFGQKDQISVMFDMTTTSPEDTRIEKQQGTIIFKEGQEIVNITLNVFKRFEFESDSLLSEVPTESTVFTVKLQYPTNRAEIGFRDTILIHYYDSYDLADTRHSYSVFSGVNPAQTRVGTQVPVLQLGQKYTVDIFSYYLSSMPQVFGKPQTYYLIQYDTWGKQLNDVSKSYFIQDNHSQVSFNAFNVTLKAVKIFAGTSGLTTSYYSNTKQSGKPYLQRIEYLFPVILNETQPLKWFNKYAIQYEFLVRFQDQTPSFSGLEMVTFSIQISENALVSVYINNQQVQDLELPMQVCSGNYDIDGSSCCQTKYSHSRMMNGSVPHHFKIAYVQRQPGFNGPCLKMTRSSRTMPLGSIEKDAIAIQELSEGPFVLDLNVTTSMVGSQNSSFIYYPGINSNNLQQLTQSQIQACVPNHFQVVIRDIFGNVFVELPNLSAKLTFTIGNTVVQNFTVFNQTDSSRRAQIYYCGPVGQATLTVTLLDKQISGSPMQLTVIPGPYFLNQSDFVEFNGQTNGCQISLPCYTKLDLRDLAMNLIQLPPLFTAKSAEFQFQHEATNSAEMFQNFTYQKVAPFSIFIQYYAQKPGLHKLFVRFGGQRVKVYPIAINVYSTVANSLQSYITNTSILTPRVVTIPLNFQVQLCDILGNNLTSSTFTIVAQLQSTSDSSIIVPQLGASKVGTSLYNVSVVAFIAQNYKLSINVTNILTGTVTPLFGVGLNITQNWQSYLANHTTSSVTGSAFQTVYTITPASLALQLRDSQRNLFNATFHKQNYTLPLFNISIVADNTSYIPITAQSATPDSGYYTFSFNVSYLYSQLNLTIFLNEFGVYKHIQGSPFLLKVVQRDPSLLCTITDLQASGFGLTSASKLVQQPTVVTAGQNYTVKIQGINLYGTIYMPTFDPVQRLYTIDQVTSACTCSPNSIFCHHFSGNYTQCSMNKQCKWVELNQDAIGGTLRSCQPCNATCDNQSYNLVLSETRDTVYTYFTLQTQLQGILQTQINVFTQGQLRMLLYKNWDFSDFHSYVSIFNLNNQMFNSTLSPFFAIKRQMWSASILGVLRFSKTQQDCFISIANKQEITNGSLTLATWTITNDLRTVVLINGQIVLDKMENQKSAQFSRYCADNELMELEIQIIVNRSIPQVENGFIKLEQETFQAAPQPLLPMNLFQIVPLTTSLQTQLQVLPSSVSALTSQVSIQNCQSGRIPFSTGVRITARDQFGNQRNLSLTDTITINVFRNNQTYSNISVVQQDLATYQYIQTVNLAEAFHNYTIQVSLNSVPLTLSPVCQFNLKNTAISAPNSALGLIQLTTYTGFNKCVFANKISFVTITMIDLFGYMVPVNDTDMYFGLYSIQFSGGSQFFNLECTTYSLPNTIKCPIMPLTTGVQSVFGSIDSNSSPFNPIPAITVLPTVHAPIDLSNPSQFSILTTNSKTTIQIFTVDTYGQTINSLSFAPCDYFAHERLIYWVGPKDADKLDLTALTTEMVATGVLKIEINWNMTKPIAQLLFVLYDGLLVQDGILFEYFSNNNLQDTPFIKLIQNQTNVPPTAFISSYDTYSTRATCYVKAPTSQTYQFTGQIGNVLIVNNEVVIADGQINGSIYLSSQLWTKIEIQQRSKGALAMQVWGNGVTNGFINSSKWQAIVPNEQAQLINDLVTF